MKEMTRRTREQAALGEFKRLRSLHKECQSCLAILCLTCCCGARCFCSSDGFKGSSAVFSGRTEPRQHPAARPGLCSVRSQLGRRRFALLAGRAVDGWWRTSMAAGVEASRKTTSHQPLNRCAKGFNPFAEQPPALVLIEDTQSRPVRRRTAANDFDSRPASSLHQGRVRSARRLACVWYARGSAGDSCRPPGNRHCRHHHRRSPGC